MQQLEAVLGVGATRGVEGVVADAGDEGDPALQADDLDGGGGDADARDPAAEGAAGEAAEAQMPAGAISAALTTSTRNQVIDGALVLAEQGEDVGGRLLEDLRVLEDRAEDGEPGDGEERTARARAAPASGRRPGGSMVFIGDAPSGAA